ncbi:hypothetical protein WAE56_02665 [Iodobacter sp. LRB]|uniref:hypothetical protein n=1 Tax=unclassified Iodobacter TaxID=235634 RepID=UPI000C0D4BA3|nr:hypothetical protein [Iodobacter sp. BJB302]PHV02982.1 hypothetical protein CSQ88_04265 [Iodobacter sp. BJB302]
MSGQIARSFDAQEQHPNKCMSTLQHIGLPALNPLSAPPRLAVSASQMRFSLVHPRYPKPFFINKPDKTGQR